jgi:ferredoxin
MATIFCFSSTGNSLYVAKKIAEKTGGKITPMNTDPGMIKDDVIGFVYPVYFWRLPRMAQRFIENLRIENKDVYIFAVNTYGGAAPGVNNQINKLLITKGQNLNYDAKVKLVDNYIPMYHPKDSPSLQQKAEEKIAKIAEDISRKENSKIFKDTFLNNISFKGMPGEDCDKHFRISDSCNGCAVCQKVCPAGNITIEGGKPAFHHHCEHCFACLQNCPLLALEWKEKTKGKKRFRKDGVSLDEIISLNQNRVSPGPDR